MTVLPTDERGEVEFIAPRHLAGGGDPAWITVPLHRACGWSYGHDPLMPRVVLSSPDRRALLRLEPDPDGQWWTLHHASAQDRPPWYASFGARTPVEIIAGFTDALTDPGAVTAADPYEPLSAAGWVLASGNRGMVSPDGSAQVDYFVSGTIDCWFTTAVFPRSPGWQARFGPHTPLHLITAFTRVLADPTPLPRPTAGQDGPALGTPPLAGTKRDLTAARVASALEDRIRALAAR